MKRILLMASGTGSNAEAIITHFKPSMTVSVCAVLSNKHDAGALGVAQKHSIAAYSFNRAAYEAPEFLDFLKSFNPDLIVLAGFLWKINLNVVQAFPKKIINIHPALLPNFGGKGMYGMHIHRAVIKSGVKETGVTIHYVNEAYDEGEVLLQKRINILPDDTPETLASRVLKIEHESYPKLIEQLLSLR